jgi:DNA-binding transcriptional MerR regulator
VGDNHLPPYYNIYNKFKIVWEDKNMEEKLLFIGKVAKQTGVNSKTIRYYEEINLLPKPKRERNNYRLYSKDTIKRINFIKKAQSLGFTLREIKEILALRDRGFKPCSHVRDLLRQRVIDLEQKLAELTILRRELKKLEDEWASVKTVEDGRDEGICPQIEKVIVRLSKKSHPSLCILKSKFPS